MVGCCRERILSGGCGWFMKNDRGLFYEEGGKWNFLDEDNKANYVYLPLVPSYSGKTDLKHYHKMNEEMMKLFADDQLDKAVTLNMQHIKELLERVPHFA